MIHKSMKLLIDTPETCGKCQFCIDNYGCNYFCAMSGYPNKEGNFNYMDVSEFLRSKHPECPFFDYEPSKSDNQNNIIKIPRIDKFKKEFFVDFNQIVDLHDIRICRVGDDGLLYGSNVQYMIIPQNEERRYKIVPMDYGYSGNHLIKYICPYQSKVKNLTVNNPFKNKE